jgi:hypothetical protein
VRSIALSCASLAFLTGRASMGAVCGSRWIVPCSLSAWIRTRRAIEWQASVPIGVVETTATASLPLVETMKQEV